MNTNAYVLKNFKFEENPWIQAIKLNNLEVLKIMDENNIPGFEEIDITEYYTSCSEVLQFLLAKLWSEYTELFDFKFKDKIMSMTVLNGDIELVKWAKKTLKLKYSTESAIIAIEYRHHDILDLIFDETQNFRTLTYPEKRHYTHPMMG